MDTDTRAENRPGIVLSMPEVSATGRVLALDYGKRRIGLAVSDALGLTAQGLDTLHRTTIREDLVHLTTLIKALDVKLILMGDPVHMSGDQSRQSGRVREFAEKLRARTGLPVKFWDERLTSAEAGRVLRDSGISIQKRARAVDRLSAVLILDSYLEWRSRSREAEQPGS